SKSLSAVTPPIGSGFINAGNQRIVGQASRLPPRASRPPCNLPWPKTPRSVGKPALLRKTREPAHDTSFARRHAPPPTHSRARRQLAGRRRDDHPRLAAPARST